MAFYQLSKGVVDRKMAKNAARELEKSIAEIILGEAADVGMLGCLGKGKKGGKWYNNGNSRDSKLPKGTGTPNLYFQREIMELRCSNEVLNVVNGYHQSIGESREIVLTKLDKPVYKPKGTVEASASTEVASVVSMVVLSCDEVERSGKGSIVLLEGYEEMSELVVDLMAMRGEEVKEMGKKVGEYNRLLKRYYEWRNDGCAEWPRELPSELEWCGYTSLPSEYKEMRWIVPNVEVGDVLSWKASVPYKAEKNTSNTAFSGLYITSMMANKEWYGSASAREIKTGLMTGMVGRNSLRGSEYNSDEYKMLTKGLSQAFVSPISKMSTEERLLYSLDMYTW